MTVILNVENKIAILEQLICREVKSYNKILKERNVGIIDLDYSLMRYLCKELEIRDVTINRSGYCIMKRKDDTTTTLGRFILEYYSKYDEQLQQILQNII